MDSKEKKRKVTIRETFSLFLSCLLLCAYCLVLSCGKKGPPTLKSYETPHPPSQSESVDSNNVETTQEESPKR